MNQNTIYLYINLYYLKYEEKQINTIEQKLIHFFPFFVYLYVIL